MSFVNNLSKRAKELFLDLSDSEREYVKLYAQRHELGLSRVEVMMKLRPELSRESASRLAYNYTNRPRVYEFLCATGEQALSVIGQSLQSSVAYYAERSLCADEILTEVAGCEMRMWEKGNKYILAPWCLSYEEIANNWRKYIKELVPADGGGYWVITRDLYGDKTRAKMRENLDKITGNTIDRVEVLNIHTNPEKIQIGKDASLEQVIQTYRKAVKND